MPQIIKIKKVVEVEEEVVLSDDIKDYEFYADIRGDLFGDDNRYLVARHKETGYWRCLDIKPKFGFCQMSFPPNYFCMKYTNWHKVKITAPVEFKMERV